MRVLPTADLAQLIGPAPFDIEPTAPAFADFAPAPSGPARILLTEADAPAIAYVAPVAPTNGAGIIGCILGSFALLAFAALIFASLASVTPAPINNGSPKHAHRIVPHAGAHQFAHVEPR